MLGTMRTTLVSLAMSWIVLALASSAGAQSVVGLYRCQAGQRCDYGPIYESFPTYGNTYPGIADCTFAAAADWEQVVLEVEPEPALVVEEFYEAGGSFKRGLAQGALWEYWAEVGGIETYRLVGKTRLAINRSNVENAVLAYRALIAELRLGPGWPVGSFRNAKAGYHDLLVDGFTPEGPLVVTWGRTIQMTWEQWAAEAHGMWALAVVQEAA
jgi:hypothetical protein